MSMGNPPIIWYIAGIWIIRRFFNWYTMKVNRDIMIKN
jgi:hypothetical protein